MPIHHSVFKNPFETKRQEIDWIDGLPYSPRYDDRFFQANVIDETSEVFIEANNLIERWRLKEPNNFKIAELGFGFGLNF